MRFIIDVVFCILFFVLTTIACFLGARAILRGSGYKAVWVPIAILIICGAIYIVIHPLLPI